MTEAYDEIPSAQNLARVRKVLVFEDALPRAFLVDDSQNVHKDSLLEVYYDSEFDPLKQLLLVMPVSMKKTENFSVQVEELSYSLNGVNVKTN